jgi:hypothetical protein
MVKRRGYPDRIGMGAKDDFFSETFVPSPQHKTEQQQRAQTLHAAGFPPEKISLMLSLSPGELAELLAIRTQPT